MSRRNIVTAFAIIFALVTIAYFLLPVRPPAVNVSQQTVIVDGEQRSFRVVIPKKLLASAPVVFAFHGIGDSPSSMANHSQLDRLASDEGFLLVYPAGRNSMWSTIEVQPASLEENSDVRFFDAILPKMSSEYDVDLSRVYLMGMSNGASFAQVLANARSTVIAGVVAHSGPRPRALIDAKTPFPVMLIVGGNDLAAESAKIDRDYYQSAGHQVDLIVVEGLGHQWSTRHNSVAWKFLSRHNLGKNGIFQQ